MKGLIMLGLGVLIGVAIERNTPGARKEALMAPPSILPRTGSVNAPAMRTLVSPQLILVNSTFLVSSVAGLTAVELNADLESGTARVLQQAYKNFMQRISTMLSTKIVHFADAPCPQEDHRVCLAVTGQCEVPLEVKGAVYKSLYGRTQALIDLGELEMELLQIDPSSSMFVVLGSFTAKTETVSAAPKRVLSELDTTQDLIDPPICCPHEMFSDYPGQVRCDLAGFCCIAMCQQETSYSPRCCRERLATDYVGRVRCTTFADCCQALCEGVTASPTTSMPTTDIPTKTPTAVPTTNPTIVQTCVGRDLYISTSARLTYGFSDDGATIREPTGEELAGLVVETERFYADVLSAAFPTHSDPVKGERDVSASPPEMTNIVMDFDSDTTTNPLPVTIDFDAAVRAVSNCVGDPPFSEVELFDAMSAADYATYIIEYVRSSDPDGTIFFHTNQVTFESSSTPAPSSRTAAPSSNTPGPSSSTPAPSSGTPAPSSSTPAP